ncbi:hypothetical protein Cadr_000029393 [Camelus dromedarius]|uniref:Uncharacterized protein n=1 Tax=Camelus dromedarius TaxID=9838 RepID=A0A5N4C5R9_CAMDR|nr:hypothetical protein Cadr_000029393 [Camelus dromedarius]
MLGGRCLSHAKRFGGAGTPGSNGKSRRQILLLLWKFPLKADDEAGQAAHHFSVVAGKQARLSSGREGQGTHSPEGASQSSSWSRGRQSQVAAGAGRPRSVFQAGFKGGQAEDSSASGSGSWLKLPAVSLDLQSPPGLRVGGRRALRLGRVCPMAKSCVGKTAWSCLRTGKQPFEPA